MHFYTPKNTPWKAGAQYVVGIVTMCLCPITLKDTEGAHLAQRFLMPHHLFFCNYEICF